MYLYYNTTQYILHIIKKRLAFSFYILDTRLISMNNLSVFLNVTLAFNAHKKFVYV